MILVPLFVRGMVKLFPAKVHPPTLNAIPFEQLEATYKKWDVAFAFLYLPLAAGCIYLFHRGLVALFHFTMKNDSAVMFIMRVPDNYFLLPAIFLGLFASMLPMTALVR